MVHTQYVSDEWMEEKVGLSRIDLACCDLLCAGLLPRIQSGWFPESFFFLMHSIYLFIYFCRVLLLIWNCRKTCILFLHLVVIPLLKNYNPFPTCLLVKNYASYVWRSLWSSAKKSWQGCWVLASVSLFPQLQPCRVGCLVVARHLGSGTYRIFQLLISVWLGWVSVWQAS